MENGNHQPVSLTSVLGEIMEQILLEATLRHMGDREEILDRQLGFTKAKFCITNPLAFYHEVTSLIQTSTAFDTFPHNIFF